MTIQYIKNLYLSRPPPPINIRVSSDVRPHSASISHNTKNTPCFGNMSSILCLLIHTTSAMVSSVLINQYHHIRYCLDQSKCHHSHCNVMRTIILSVTYFVIGCLSTIISPTSVHTLHTLPLRSSVASPRQNNNLVLSHRFIASNWFVFHSIRQRRVSCCGPLCSGTRWGDRPYLPYPWNRGWREGNFTRESASIGNR